MTHLDGWLWLGGTGALLAALALASGALAFLTARALAAARLVAHDLGDAIEPSMPGIARAATLVAVVALPVALGEGLVGLALGLVAVAFVERSLGQRIAVGLAALCLFAAVHPVARVAAAHFGMLRSDPTGVASWDAEAGFLDPLDAVRLARAAGSPGRGDADPLAAAALAEWTRRSGDLARAGDYYGALVAEGGADPNVLSNAAALALARSDPQAAIELYRRAIAIEPTAELWFNLSQAHGAVIDVEQHDRALAAAQALDPIAVSELTKRLAGTRTPYVPGSPLPQARVRERLGMQLADTDAMPLRDVLAPGWLGRSGLAMLVAFGIAAALGAGFGRAVEPSSRCADCAAHLCRRCGRAPRNDARCEACHRRRFEGRGPWEHGRERARAPRSAGERVRGFASWLFPGLVRTSSRGAAFGLPVALAGAAALVFGLGHAKVLPDPGSIGGAGALLGALAAAVCCAMHLALAAIAGLVARRNPS